jgi:hypothetical protein
MSQDLLPGLAGLVSSLTPAGLASTVTPAGLSCAVTPAGPTSKLTPGGAGEPDPDTIKMFVGQVPRTMSEQDLVNLFQVRVHYIPESFREKPELLKALTRTWIQDKRDSVTRVFASGFCHKSSSPKSLKITSGSFQFFPENSRRCSQSKVRHRRQILPPAPLVLLIPVANNGNNICLFCCRKICG